MQQALDPQTLSDILTKYYRPCPSDGVNTAVFGAVSWLHQNGYPEEMFYEAVRLWRGENGMDRRNEHQAEEEIRRAIRRVVSGLAGEPDNHYRPQTSADVTRIEEVVGAQPGADAVLRAESPDNIADIAKDILASGSPILNLSPDTREARAIAALSLLFPVGTLVCLAKSYSKAETFTRVVEAQMRFAPAAQYIVPTRAHVPEAMTEDKELSPKARGCFVNPDGSGSRDYVVLDIDPPTAATNPKLAGLLSYDGQAAIILHLAEKYPLGMVVKTGGKSYHAWFNTSEMTEAEIGELIDDAVLLGGDERPLAGIQQLVRMPGGIRLNKATGKPEGEQEVIYLDRVNLLGGGEVPRISAPTTTPARTSVAASPSSTGQPPVPDMYQDTAGKFWLQAPEGHWYCLPRAVALKHLDTLGFPSRVPPGSALVTGENVVQAVERQKQVAFAGPLAGHKAGFYNRGGKRFLVTSDQPFLEAKEGDWTPLREFWRRMLPVEEDADQLDYFFAWMRGAYLSGLDGDPDKHQPGQMLVFAGPRNAGKSLTQAMITRIFGGAAGKPFVWMTGVTPFNAEMAEYVHQELSDEVSHGNWSARAAFADRLKNLVANKDQYIHAKGLKPVMLQPFWRVTLSTNDDEASLQVLPTLGENTRDKVLLLRAESHPMPFDPANTDSKRKYIQSLFDSLPGFLHWLVTEFTPPPAMADGRFGVKGYINAATEEALGDLSREAMLLSLIDEVYFDGSDDAATRRTLPPRIEKTAIAMLEEIKASRPHSSGGFTNAKALGIILKKLSEMHPERVSRRIGRARKCYWVLAAPSENL